MPRGRLLKTKKREAYHIAKAEEKGRLQAQIEAAKKTDLPTEIKMWLRKWMEKIDPIEAAAIIGGTFVVHEVIFKTAEFLGTVQDFVTNSPVAPFLIPFNVFIFGPFAKPPFSDLPQQDEDKPIEIKSDLMLWFIAFGISYYAVRHGGDLLNIAQMFFARKPTT